MHRLAALLGALAALTLAAPAPAQDAAAYPSRTIRIVVPFPPTGITDRLARTLAQKMQESWGQPVVVDNRPGASGMIAAEVVARSAPDGYTLMMGHIGTHAVNASLFARLPYDPVRDFAPVSLLLSVPNILLVHPAVPAGSVTELVALARAKPGTLSFASPGSGTSGHMSGELLKSMTGIDIVHVPYKGSGQAMQDLLAGHVTMQFDTLASSLPQVRAGKLKGLAVTSATRNPAAPELPTLAESGVPGYEIAPWFAAYAPAGTPAVVIDRLNAEMRRILALPDVRAAFVDQQGVTLIASTPAELAAHTQREIAKWAQVVKATGAKAD